ncbi:hypothetical protein DES49_0292 [Halospina denitrificans]|uniref:Uncharacterized protein n=1 Tax=Halospina denitrificans TaxID=332522 RepID=A0A4R7K048_9GAMM|nr:hypothetical protein [Halospina denitrificans]TDT44192.1 hypothetical protein DES49_0292 [Halospina denitrificans]
MRTKLVKQSVRRQGTAPVEATRWAEGSQRPQNPKMTLEALTRPAQTRSLKAALRQK